MVALQERKQPSVIVTGERMLPFLAETLTAIIPLQIMLTMLQQARVPTALPY